MSLKQMQALDANKEALAQPEQGQFALKHRIAELEGAVIGLQAQRTWVGLTDEEIEMIYAVTIKVRKKDIMPGEQKMFAKTIQHFLKERNT